MTDNKADTLRDEDIPDEVALLRSDERKVERALAYMNEFWRREISAETAVTLTNGIMIAEAIGGVVREMDELRQQQMVNMVLEAIKQIKGAEHPKWRKMKNNGGLRDE